MRSRSMCVSQAKKREDEALRTLEREEMSSTFVCFLDNNRTLNDRVKYWVHNLHMNDNLDVARNCWTNPGRKEEDSEDKVQFVRRMKTSKIKRSRK